MLLLFVSGSKHLPVLRSLPTTPPTKVWTRVYQCSEKWSCAELQSCIRLKASPSRTKVLRYRCQSLYMPAVNRKLRSDASSKPGIADCTTLLSIDSHKLVKVRSIRPADAVGASEVQAVLASGDNISCILPKNLQSQLLFRGSGFFIVSPASTRSTPHTPSEAQPNINTDNNNWTVVYVLTDEDPPDLARQGYWPPQFECEGIDGLSNGYTVDLRTAPRVSPPTPQQTMLTQFPELNKVFNDSDEDDEEHEIGCACCPGGRNVVFRVY